MSSSIKHHFTIGSKYTKSDIKNILKEPSLVPRVGGIFYCQKTNDTLLFCDLIKEGKDSNFHYKDYFDENYFHWDSQNGQHIQSPEINKIVKGEKHVHLFARLNAKIKSKTNPFIYCGILEYYDHDHHHVRDPKKPIHIIFDNIDYNDIIDNQDLLEIYYWQPFQNNVVAEPSIPRIPISPRRKKQYNPPNETERKGLVTTRVGQGYYRQEIIQKWNGTCPVTKCNIERILIASHIVSWKDSTKDERIDVENGILLSPNADALFDRHLISFEDDGKIIFSSKISRESLEALGLNSNIKITITSGMKKYLKRHRAKMIENG